MAEGIFYFAVDAEFVTCYYDCLGDCLGWIRTGILIKTRGAGGLYLPTPLIYKTWDKPFLCITCCVLILTTPCCPFNLYMSSQSKTHFEPIFDEGLLFLLHFMQVAGYIAVVEVNFLYNVFCRTRAFRKFQQ